MTDPEIIKRLRKLARKRAHVAAILIQSPLAPPGKSLSGSAIGMWQTRGEIADAWRPAALERLNLIRLSAGVTWEQLGMARTG